MNGPIRNDPPGETDTGRTACDREPVHAPGTIQPHGLLLVLRTDPDGGRLRVVAASGNTPAGQGPVSLAGLLEPDAVARIEHALSDSDVVTDPVIEGLVSQDGRRWTGLIRRDQTDTLLELEPEQATDAPAIRRILLGLNQAIALLQHQPDAVAACQVATRHLRGITGFDRVMAYRFMADWSGEVIAESIAPGVDSYLGLVFPASDIPAPARALYASNRLRLIPDSRSAQVPLVPPAGPVDLGQAVLRGVAPVHLEYLANMGVHASMSVAIAGLPDGASREAGASGPIPALWGLLACHHQHGPLFVDHVRRQAAETLSQALSWRLGWLADAAAGRRIAMIQETLASILGTEGGLVPGTSAAARAGETLLHACMATGMAVLGPAGMELADPAIRVGVLPSEDALRHLADWLDRQPARLLLTDRLPSLLPAALLEMLGPDHPCGLLATPLATSPANAAEAGGWVLWFRPELRRQVDWAGYKAVDPLPAQVLHPRASFAAWREEVADRSAAWGADCVAAAMHFREGVVASLLRRSAQIAREATLLRRRNEAISFFADAATHDLREPLWQIQVLSGLIRDGLRGLFGDADPAGAPRHPAHEALVREVADLELETMSGLVVTSAGRMRAMIDDLARFAVAGRDADRLRPVHLRQLADEALEDVGEALRDVPGVSLSFDGLDDVVINGDPAQLRRVFQNLLSNGIKYRSVSRPLCVIVSARRHGTSVHVDFADNGIGFDIADRVTMFEPFRRLHHAMSVPTDGLGLGLSICQRIVEAHGGTIEATPLAPGAHISFILRDPAPGSPGGHDDAV
ncbi:MAG: ATP-binding protein [Janthinobacterium lividum]